MFWTEFSLSLNGSLSIFHKIIKRFTFSLPSHIPLLEADIIFIHRKVLLPSYTTCLLSSCVQSDSLPIEDSELVLSLMRPTKLPVYNLSIKQTQLTTDCYHFATLTLKSHRIFLFTDNYYFYVSFR